MVFFSQMLVDLSSFPRDGFTPFLFPGDELRVVGVIRATHSLFPRAISTPFFLPAGAPFLSYSGSLFS